MTKHQYLHLTHQISQLQHAMVNDFTLMAFLGMFFTLMLGFAIFGQKK